MDIDRKQIMETFIRIIDHISDKEYQKRIWVLGEGPECDDFDETICHFFEEGDDILENYKDFGITDKQYQLLIKFRDAFESFSDENNWPAEFIDTPEWDKIMEMAKNVLKAFGFHKN